MLDDLDAKLAAAETADGLDLLEHLFGVANEVLRVGDAAPAERPVLQPERVEELAARLVVLVEVASERLVYPGPETISSGLRCAAGILRACMQGADVDEADIQDQADDLGVLTGELFAAARRERFMSRFQATHPAEAAQIRAVVNGPAATTSLH